MTTRSDSYAPGWRSKNATGMIKSGRCGSYGPFLRTIATENPADDVCRYLRHWTNRAYAEEQIRLRHPGLSTDKRRKKANDLSASVNQGLELIALSRDGTLATKPLPLFYAAEALAKAISIYRIEGLDGGGFRQHGLKGVKKRRYYIRTLSCKVGQSPMGVWQQFVTCANADWMRYSGEVGGVSQTRSWRQPHPVPPPTKGSELELRELLRHLPELNEDLRLAGWGFGYSVLSQAPNTSLNYTESDPPEVWIRARLRHGHDEGVKSLISRAVTNGRLREYTLERELLDITDVSRPRLPGWPALPAFRTDIFGDTYWDIAPATVGAENLIYYAALFILSDVVRYQGQWRRLVEDHPEEAILIDRFLEIAARKLPNLALNELSDQIYLFKTSRS